MKGSVRKRGSTWSYCFDLGMVDGKRKRKEKGGFRTKKECEAALTVAMHDFEINNFVENKVLFKDFTSEWLNNYVKPLRKITTYNRYKEIYKKYLSCLDDLDIADITSRHIEKILLDHRNTVRNTVSNTTLQGVYTLVNSIFNRAYKLKVVKENPCDFIERPKREKFKADTLSADEINLMIKYLDLDNEYDYMFYIALRITVELGLRRGELCGLEWQNLNCEENTISIENNMVYTNGSLVVTTPKTIESCRSIYVSDNLIKDLKFLEREQKKNKLVFGEFYEKNIFNDRQYDFIMRWSSGKYIHPSWYSAKINKTVKKCKIDKHIRFHDLRHTNATLLLSQGVDFKTIQTRLGHKDINTTLNIYSHVNKEMQKDATEKLDNIIVGKSSANKKH